MRAEIGVDLPLQRLALRRALDHEIGGAKGLEPGHRSDAVERRLPLLLRDPAGALLPPEIDPDRSKAGGDPVRRDVVEEDFVARKRADMGDPGPHLPGPDNANLGDRTTHAFRGNDPNLPAGSSSSPFSLSRRRSAARCRLEVAVEKLNARTAEDDDQKRADHDTADMRPPRDQLVAFD